MNATLGAALDRVKLLAGASDSPHLSVNVRRQGGRGEWRAHGFDNWDRALSIMGVKRLSWDARAAGCVLHERRSWRLGNLWLLGWAATAARLRA